jgi:ribosome-binding factor A
VPYRRADRVNALLQRELGQVISEELNDPRITFATVTAVETTPDLRTARVHVSILGDETQGREAMAAIERAKRHLRKVLGERTELRYVPDLVFIEDRSAERAARIATLLREARERGVPPGGSGEHPDG